MSIRIKSNFTIIPNEIFDECQLSATERFIYCLMLRHCGKVDNCFPSQETLGRELGLTARHVRTLIERLISAGLVSKRRRGWNRSNTYTVSKELRVDGKSGSYHLGSKFPLHRGNVVPDKSTYLKGKGKKSNVGFERLKKSLVERGLFRQR